MYTFAALKMNLAKDVAVLNITTRSDHRMAIAKIVVNTKPGQKQYFNKKIIV